MSEKFKDLSNMKEEAQKILDQSQEKYEVNTESQLAAVKDRIATLKFNIEYHTNKLVESKQELEFIVNKLEGDMAKALVPTNDPIDITKIPTPAYPK